MELFEKINEIKASSGISIAEFARKTGVSPRYISDIISGRSKEPRPSFLTAVVSSLGVSPNWLLTGEGPMFSGGQGKPPSAGNQTIQSSSYEIPLLTKEEAKAYNVKQEIPDPKAHSGEYPDKILLPAPHWLREFSTDLRAIAIFNSRMAPVLTAGDIAIFEGSGYMGDGIYLYRLEGELGIGYIHWVNNSFVTWTEFRPEKIKTDEIDPIGRIRATVKMVL